MPIFECHELSKDFGGLKAVSDLDLEINPKEIRGIIGPNGAGKTTVFNLISGVYPPSRGTVVFKEEDITKLPVHVRAQRGITRTFQVTNLFMDSTVYENVCVGCHQNYKSGSVRQFLHTPLARAEQKTERERALEILTFMGLGSLKEELARSLPYGYQRTLGICVALAASPTLLLLDEPVAGMNPEETAVTVELVRKIRDRGITILIVEHDMWAIKTLCDKVSVLESGRKIAEGTPDEIMSNRRVIEAYLGKDEEGGDATRS